MKSDGNITKVTEQPSGLHSEFGLAVINAAGNDSLTVYEDHEEQGWWVRDHTGTLDVYEYFVLQQ